MANVFTKIRGIVGSFFTLGADGPGFKRSTDPSANALIEAKNNGDSAYVILRGKEVNQSNSLLNDLVPLIDLQGRIPNIHFAFDGESPPLPGANTGEFGFCHTTGGSYTAGQVVYDDGTSLVIMPSKTTRHLTTEVEVTGTISLIDNGIYALEGGTWVLKGDGTAGDRGLVKMIEVKFNYSSTTELSTTALPSSSSVLSARVQVEIAFNGSSPSVAVTNGATSLMVAGDSYLAAIGIYEVPQNTATSAAVVTVTLTGGGSTVGEGLVQIMYVAPLP